CSRPWRYNLENQEIRKIVATNWVIRCPSALALDLERCACVMVIASSVLPFHRTEKALPRPAWTTRSAYGTWNQERNCDPTLGMALDFVAWPTLRTSITLRPPAGAPMAGFMFGMLLPARKFGISVSAVWGMSEV